MSNLGINWRKTMAFLVIYLLHHFILCVPLSLFCISILYLFCTFLIFCLLHFPQLIVYDGTLKVKYFVWDIFELNWNSYLPILFPSAFQLVFYHAWLLRGRDCFNLCPVSIILLPIMYCFSWKPPMPPIWRLRF